MWYEETFWQLKRLKKVIKGFCVFQEISLYQLLKIKAMYIKCDAGAFRTREVG